MHYITYLFFRFVCFLFRLLPMWLIYKISDCLSYVLLYIIKYRTIIVKDNLRLSNLNIDSNNLSDLMKQIYLNLSDTLLETIKAFSISEMDLSKRVEITNLFIAEDYYKQNKSIIIAASHYANFEWTAMLSSKLAQHKAIGFYKPLSNKYIDKYVQQHRAKFGEELGHIGFTSQIFEENKNTLCLFQFISDQSPSNVSKAIWVDFMGRKTACSHGLEKYAKHTKLPVVYAHFRRLKRGFYRIELELLCDNAENLKENEITQRYMSLLEKYLHQDPSSWLWTHKRWKHTKKADV